MGAVYGGGDCFVAMRQTLSTVESSMTLVRVFNKFSPAVFLLLC